MAKSFKDKRMVFKKGEQRKLLLEFVWSSEINRMEAARFFGIVPRSFTDWLNEKIKLPLRAYNKIHKNIRKKYNPVKIIDKFWYAKKGAKLGGIALHKKYGPVVGDQEYRKKKWREWWNTEGNKKFRVVGSTKTFQKPPQSKNLAEFIGIMIGDGGITQYQSIITLNNETDKKYADYVKKLVYKLFKVKPRTYLKKGAKAITIVVSRKLLNEYLVSLGLKSGNKLKQNLDIPSWVMKNIEYAKMCLRGLIDTDGCIFYERHKIKEKKYSYARLNFVTGSILLASSVIKILNEVGFHPKLRRNGKNHAVQLENRAEIWEYFKVIGTSNQKHFDRLSKY